MDEIQKRLQETTETCSRSYEEWRKSKNDIKAQEGLHSAIHELRKVASRLEIELAVRERQDITSKPLPIPSHKSSSNKNGDAKDDISDGGSDRPNVQHAVKRRRPSGKPSPQGAPGEA